jgi:hypothetical protein
MSAVFVLGLAVQYNDPDPVFWMALYAGVAVLSAGACLGRGWPRTTLVALILYAAITLYWLPGLGQVRPESFTSFQMKSPQDEVVREAAGLLLCTGWLALLLWHVRRLRPADHR